VGLLRMSRTLSLKCCANKTQEHLRLRNRGPGRPGGRPHGIVRWLSALEGRAERLRNALGRARERARVRLERRRSRERRIGREAGQGRCVPVSRSMSQRFLCLISPCRTRGSVLAQEGEVPGTASEGQVRQGMRRGFGRNAFHCKLGFRYRVLSRLHCRLVLQDLRVRRKQSTQEPDIGTKFAVKSVTPKPRRIPLPDLTSSRCRHLAFLPQGHSLVFLQGEIKHKNSAHRP